MGPNRSLSAQRDRIHVLNQSDRRTAKIELPITESMLTGDLLVRLEASALGSGGLSGPLAVRSRVGGGHSQPQDLTCHCDVL